MSLAKISSIFVVTLASLVSFTVQDDMCGLTTPDPNMTCISIRLPWNSQPMYFCTDKEKFRYRDQCQNRFSNNCGFTSIRQNKLLIATPWDCCPLTSDPDSCSEQKCSPPPLNRDCREVNKNPNTPWECCPTYFCEANATPQTCHFKQLDPACNTPPQGKSNCVAFTDSFGCCPKFYCDEDSHKTGECPAEVDAKKYMARFNSTNSTMEDITPTPLPIPSSTPAAHFAAIAGDYAFKRRPGNSENIPCIGDFNCPGNLKCCSNDMNVYLQDGRYTFRNRNPTYGYCVEPADKNKEKESSPSYAF